MATIYNMAGTTSHTFTLGDGTTIFYGIANPIDSMGKVGDIYISMNKKLSNENDYDDVETQQELIDFPADYQQEEGHALPIGYIVRLVENEVSTYYKWNGSSWDELFNDNDPLGRIYYKEAFEDGSRWNFIKSYSFDEDIIHAVETSLNSNDFKIAIESADNTGIVTSTKQNDYTENHSAYGVTRFASDAEGKASAIENYQTYSSTNLPTNFNTSGQKFMDKYIALTPKQVAENIKVEMTRAITVEGTLNSLNTGLTKTNLVAAINSENTRAKGIEGNLTDLNFYNDSSWTGTKNLVTAINFENNRAKSVEGNLSDLTTEDKSNLVAAINSEASARDAEDVYLQQQIDAITSKSDVIDIVDSYANLLAYDTAHVDTDDIIKVLKDETDNDATTYYRFSLVPTNPDYTVATKANLPTASSSTLDKIAKVNADESQSGSPLAYYECRSVNGTPTWVLAGPKYNQNPEHSSEAHLWDYVGQEGSYYTKAESDARFVRMDGNVAQTITGKKTFSTTPVVGTLAENNNSTSAASTAFVTRAISTEDAKVVHIEGNESITGQKEFKNANLAMKSPTFDSTNPTEYNLHFAFLDKNGVEAGHIKNEYTSSGKLQTGLTAKRTVNGEDKLAVIAVGVQSDGTIFTTANTPSAMNTTSSDQIATVGWVNDPAKSTNVVHRTGNESIAGTKTLTGTLTVTGTIGATGGTVNVKTQAKNNSSTLAASTAFVVTEIKDYVGSKIPVIVNTTADQVLSNNGTGYVWKTVYDITTLKGLTDTYISNETAGQVLIYDSTLNANAGGWKNGSQVTATIKYW